MVDTDTELSSELEEVTDDAEGNAAPLADDESVDLLDSTDDDSDNESSREEQRKKSAEGQMKKAQKLLDEGKPLPDSLKWTLPHLYAPTEKAETPRVNVQDVKAELKDELMFDTLQEEYKKLPKEFQTLAKEKFQLYRSKGFMKGEALKEVLSIVSIKTDASKEAKRRAAAIPDVSTARVEQKDTSNMSAEEKFEYFKKLAGA